MKSLPTKYNGYHFRSRLEARWAVFFEAMGIKYYYEFEDYLLPGNIRYLPDFYLPKYNGGCIAEVKGEFKPDEIEKCKQLCILTKLPVLLLEGMPDLKLMAYFSFQEYDGRTELYEYAGWIHERGYIWVEDLIECWPDLTDYHQQFTYKYEQAVMKSRSARFEFMENIKT